MKACIFDFDYTLGDTTEGILECISSSLEKLGFPPAGREEMRRTIGLSLDATLERLTGCRDADTAREFTKLFMRRADDVMVASAVFYPEALPLLGELHEKGVLTAIVTTKAAFRIRGILDKFSARDLVDVIVGSDMVKNEKPHPEALLLALRLLNVGPEEALYIGDSAVDAACARDAGVPFAAVLTGTTGEAAFRAYPHTALFRDLSGLRTEVI